jgi:phosphoribosylaminoimidazolecarboxamide formyltransferase/IMP cyclohydrolase
MPESVQSAQPATAVGPGEVRVTRAVLSVSDKRGLADFARGLADLGVELVSTGGTARALAEAGVAHRTIDDLTGFPEIMDGRVKTLHPKLHAGLLAVRDSEAHLREAVEQDIEWVDLVCVNLYPFEATVGRLDAGDAEVIENIDIGGPTMIRAAAKNHAFAAPVVSPESYDAVLEELRSSDRRLSLSTRRSLAGEAFAYTARYDIAIARWFAESEDDLPQMFVRAFEKVTDLSYGENPHQRAAYYGQVGARTHLLSQVRQLGGKALSFNNLLDLSGARMLARELEGPACVIVKHGNPCGAAIASDPLEAYRRAFACDEMSAFGGVIVLNRRVDRPLAEALVGQFIEVLLAPGYDDEALEVLHTKPNMRIMADEERRGMDLRDREIRQVPGGLLVQDRDLFDGYGTDPALQTVTGSAPTDRQLADLRFAWIVCKHVRSNAIVLVRDGATVGVGAGQMSRVDSVRLAVDKAQPGMVDGSVMASDAFFPFPDAPQAGIDAGVRAIIQPGGSKRDELSIEAADAAGVAMVFTGRRHFRH